MCDTLQLSLTQEKESEKHGDILSKHQDLQKLQCVRKVAVHLGYGT
jgi:hypothetical protein